MLISCAVYKAGKKVADIPTSEIASSLKQPDAFIWVALKDPTTPELAEMHQAFDLHELAVEDARKGHQRPKIEEYSDHLFAVLHTVERHEELLLRGEVAIFVGPNFVLSVRSRTQQGFQNVRERCEREPHLLKFGAGFVFYALMDAIVDRYFPILDEIELELEEIEDQIFARAAARASIERLYQLKQKVLLLRHAVTPLLDAIGRLYGGRVPQVCLDTQDYFRDVADHLVRINSSIDAIREMIATAMQVNLSLVTIDETEVSKKLAAWAGIFGVATAFAGVWGMNFKGMPELEWQYGYPVALGLIIVSCTTLYWRFKKSKWL